MKVGYKRCTTKGEHMNTNKTVPMPGLDRLQERANETLLDHFDWVCTEMCKQENSKGCITKKLEKDYTDTKAEILSIMNRKENTTC